MGVGLLTDMILVWGEGKQMEVGLLPGLLPVKYSNIWNTYSDYPYFENILFLERFTSATSNHG